MKQSLIKDILDFTLVGDNSKARTSILHPCSAGISLPKTNTAIVSKLKSSLNTSFTTLTPLNFIVNNKLGVRK